MLRDVVVVNGDSVQNHALTIILAVLPAIRKFRVEMSVLPTIRPKRTGKLVEGKGFAVILPPHHAGHNCTR